MRLISRLAAALVVLAAAGLAVLGAVFAANLIERDASADVAAELESRGMGWAEVATDGLQVRVSGAAPSESARFRALGAAGEVVDSARVIDAMQVAPAEPIAAPRFSLEILRNGPEISLIGLVPAATGREAPADRLRDVADGAEVTNLLETAAFAAPEGWSAAVDYALAALEHTPRARVSVTADSVEIAAAADSRSARADLRAKLATMQPDAVEAALDISAPRPVIAPFVLRFVRDGDGARLPECSAGGDAAAKRIAAAAHAAGAPEDAACRVGLGRPAPSWAEAAERAIAALAELGHGTLTMSDADITLLAAAGTPQAAFDRVSGRLATALPDFFALETVRAEPEKTPPDASARSFVATRGADGAVRVRGAVPGPGVREATLSLARARLGGDGDLSPALHTAPGLPPAWSDRILAAVEALGRLDHGKVTVDGESLSVTGTAGRETAGADVTRLLVDKLGEDASVAVDIAYDEALDPTAGLPTRISCVSDINAALEAGKITFAPGSAEIAADARPVLGEIAAILERCEEVEMRLEIAGYTDSQGRAEMNAELSRQRAEAVLSALVSRRVLTDNITAAGYGESVPVADNDTAAGREANRRIEVRLRGPDTDGVPPPARVAPSATDDGDGAD